MKESLRKLFRYNLKLEKRLLCDVSEVTLCRILHECLTALANEQPSRRTVSQKYSLKPFAIVLVSDTKFLATIIQDARSFVLKGKICLTIFQKDFGLLQFLSISR